MSHDMKGVSILLAAALCGCGSGGDEGTAVTQDLAAASTSLTLDLPPTSSPKSEPTEPALAEPVAEPKIEAPAAVPAPAPPSPKTLAEPRPRTEPPLAAPPAPAPPAAPAAEQLAAASQPAEVPVPPEPAAPVGMASRLPLPEAVLARTIERIGYSCGEVVGTERIDGSRGPVYRINCSSGETFRGTTKRGRMYFRRLGEGR